jgi:hypothetical protein
MKLLFMTVFAISIFLSINLENTLALPLGDRSGNATWMESLKLNSVALDKRPIQLAQSNLWNPDFHKGKQNNNTIQRNDRNNNQGQQNQLWNPDFRKDELQRHNDVDQRRDIRKQVYDGIYSSPKGSTSPRHSNPSSRRNNDSSNQWDNVLEQLNRTR